MATATYTGKLTDFAEAPFPDAEPSLTVRPKHDGFGPQGLLSTRRIPVTVASNGSFSFELTPSASVLPPQSYILRCDWLGGFGYSEWEFEARAGGGNIKDMGVIDQMGLWRDAAMGTLPPLVEAEFDAQLPGALEGALQTTGDGRLSDRGWPVASDATYQDLNELPPMSGWGRVLSTALNKPPALGSQQFNLFQMVHSATAVSQIAIVVSGTGEEGFWFRSKRAGVWRGWEQVAASPKRCVHLEAGRWVWDGPDGPLATHYVLRDVNGRLVVRSSIQPAPGATPQFTW